MPPGVTDARYCDVGIALVADGRTVDHLTGWKAVALAGVLTLLAADAGAFVFDGMPAELAAAAGEVSAA
jgi:hypothetical protein